MRKKEEGNSSLRSSVGRPEERLNRLENHSQWNNLFFFGIEERRNQSRIDCERTLKDIIYNEMGVRTEVVLERAHRVGAAIIGKFLSYKDKMEVLSHGKFLKGSTISVKENVSLRVREKQKGLMPLMKNL